VVCLGGGGGALVPICVSDSLKPAGRDSGKRVAHLLTVQGCIGVSLGLVMQGAPQATTGARQPLRVRDALHCTKFWILGSVCEA
jgi:hypothetical protein